MGETSTSFLEPWQRRLQHLRTHARKGISFVSGMVATFAALLLYNLLAPPPTPLTLNEVNETVVQAMASATPPPAYSSLVYQVIQPALVFIQVEVPGEDENEEEGHGLGTGVVINDSGDILTSLHVVTNATTIQLTFADGTEASAQIVGWPTAQSLRSGRWHCDRACQSNRRYFLCWHRLCCAN